MKLLRDVFFTKRRKHLLPSAFPAILESDLGVSGVSEIFPAR